MPDRNPHPIAAPDIARLAAEFGDNTSRALALARVADQSESPADQLAAGEAALTARRPAAALRLAAMAGQHNPDDPAVVRLRANAERGLVEARRSRARAGEGFIRELLALVQAAIDAGAGRTLGALLATNAEGTALDGLVVSRDGTAGVSALDIVNAVLSRLGSGGVALVAVGDNADGFVAVGARRVELRVDRQPSVVELAEAAAVEGTACNGCGAPRYMQAHDDDLGEFCSVCAFPLAPEHLVKHRQRATVGTLTAELAEVRRERDRAATLAAERAKTVEGLQGKIQKLTGQAQGERDRRIALVRAGSSPLEMLLADPTTPIEDLQAAAAGAVERAQASAAQADRVAVEIARRQGKGAPPG
jgi:hypothetical protein